MSARRIAWAAAAALALGIAAPEASAQYGTPTCQQPGGQQMPGCAPYPAPSPQGQVFRGAAGGAARGALIGAISGNAGRGAAIGAATGGVFAAGRRAAYR